MAPACRRSLLLVFRVALALALPLSLGSAAEPAAESHVARPANRLAKETSPYLLLHAHNPVDWYPWGEEALAKARREKKPIFLSVGYSSCYWCHVMERESFSDDEIAALLNEHFVCIKVDREERPDIDEVYMRALEIYFQATGAAQGGGWPLSMFLTPDGKPLTGGTYFPPRDSDGRQGFLTIVQRVRAAWSEDPAKWQAVGDKLADFVRQSLDQRPVVPLAPLTMKLVDEVEEALAGEFDEQYGGFGFSATNSRRPKFPQPADLLFLVHRASHAGNDRARKMLLTTLDQMAQGGIRDHLGGGFHRYSTDRFWRVPHFEKMLYDNGQLLSVYAEAYRLTQRAEYRRVADEIAGFLLRELTDADGGFHTALDAETDGLEGAYYLWQREEVARLLSADELTLVEAVYGLGGQPNHEERYILLAARPLAEIARERKLSEEQLARALVAPRQKLLAARAARPRPLTDTKILAGCNGLAIRGLADAGRLLEQPPYVHAAARAADFALTRLRTPEGALLRCFAGGQAKQPAFLEDYAQLVDGLIALHRATGEARWLAAADELTALQLKLFWDERGGGFFNTSGDHEQLLARGKSIVDAALPGSNAVSAGNLIYLARALDKPDYLARAKETVRAFSPWISDLPTGVPRLATSLAALLEATAAKVPSPQ